MREYIDIVIKDYRLYKVEGFSYDYYTFIGPVNKNLMERFMKTANEIASIVAASIKLYHVHNQKLSVQIACQSLPSDTAFRIYVAEILDILMLLHSIIEEYCEKHGIKRE